MWIEINDVCLFVFFLFIAFLCRVLDVELRCGSRRKYFRGWEGDDGRTGLARVGSGIVAEWRDGSADY